MYSTELIGVKPRLHGKHRAQEGEGDLARARFSQESALVFDSRLGTVDCEAVEVQGQFLESRGRTFFPVCRVLPGYYNIITRELRFLPYYTNRTCIMENSTVIIQVLNTGP